MGAGHIKPCYRLNMSGLLDRRQDHGCCAAAIVVKRPYVVLREGDRQDEAHSNCIHCHVS